MRKAVKFANPHIHFYSVGTGSPVAMFHGFGRSGQIWQRNISFLAQFKQVVIIDLPGHGRSEFAGRWLLRDIASQLVKWLQQKKLSPLILVGHSMGGAIAIYLTSQMPHIVEKLILVDSIGLPLQTNAYTLMIRALLTSIYYPSGIPPWKLVSNLLRTSPGLLHQIVQDVVKSDLRTEITSITVPTLIIWGEHDKLLPLSIGRELNAAIRGSTFVVLPRSGHCPHLQEPERFNKIVAEFIL